MNYINKPTKPNKDDFKNGEDLIAAMESYIERMKKYEKQCELLSDEFRMVAMLFEKNSDLRNADRMQEINEIKDRAEKRLFPESAPTTIFSMPKQKTKTAIVNFRIEQEIKDEFAEMCNKNNMTVAEALKNAMLRAIDEQRSVDRMDKHSKNA